jgi:glycerol-3-phosphate dehydrogenase (NAD(P)+)
MIFFKKNNMKIGILGSGSFGTALAITLSQRNQVTLWGNDPETAEEILTHRTNKKFLKDATIPENVQVTLDISKLIKNSDLIIFAVPSHATREVAVKAKKYLQRKTILVSVAKGLEEATELRMSQVLHQILPANPIVVLSGPSHAEELANGIPTNVVAASRKDKHARRVQETLVSPTFRIYTSRDVVGVELGGVLKNIIALAAGINDGLNFGSNSKAALITRGLVEIIRFGRRMGASKETFLGLSGMGDLIVTCTSSFSRNWTLGNKIGKGKNLEEAISEMSMVCEGVKATRVVSGIARKKRIDMITKTGIRFNISLFLKINPQELSV